MLSNFFMVAQVRRGASQGFTLHRFGPGTVWTGLSPGPSGELAWPQTEDHSDGGG